MTDAERAKGLEGVADSMERQGFLPEHRESLRRAAHALRIKGQLVEALERCARWTPIGEDHSCATAALKAAKET